MGRPKAVIPGLVTFEKPKKVKIDELKFDVQNIRIWHISAKNEKEAGKFLWQIPDMELLYEDIKQKGLQEELIINKNNRVIDAVNEVFVEYRLYPVKL